MQKTGSVLAVIGAHLSFIPCFILLGLVSFLENQGGYAGSFIEPLGVVLIIGSLFFCAVTLVAGIVAFETPKPMVVGIIVIGSTLLGLLLGRAFAFPLIFSLIGGILVGLAQLSPKDVPGFASPLWSLFPPGEDETVEKKKKKKKPKKKKVSNQKD